MKRFMPAAALVLAVAFVIQAADPPPRGTWKASGKNGAVAAGGAEAVEAGLTLLKQGGNAIDGAVATLLALTVTDERLFCFGGEVPIMVYDAKRNVVEVLCGLGAAPKLATREHFAKDGIPGKGVEPAAVPGQLDACITALDRYGTKTFAEAVAPALKILDRNEKDWRADLARTIRRLTDAEKTSPNDRRRGLRLASDYFYRGPIAHEIDEWCKANGGLIRYSDLATHTTRIEDPVSGDYRGYTVYKCGVWTQGPYLLETLKLLEGFDPKPLGHNSAQTIHLEVESLKLGLADRDIYFADPNFSSVALNELLASKYAELRRPLIDRQNASLVQRPGDPKTMKAMVDKPDLRSETRGTRVDRNA